MSEIIMTDVDQQALDAYEEHRSYRKAAAALGLSYGTLYRRVKSAQEGALFVGNAPAGYRVAQVTTRTNKDGEQTGQSVRVKEDSGDADEIIHVVDPKKVKFTTTVFDAKRGVERQWVREEPDAAAKAELWEEYAEALKARIERPYLIPLSRPDYDDRLAVYPIGDMHVGMLAWGIETRGASYDLKTSEQLLAQAAAHLMAQAAPAKQALLCIMGDFVHFDGFKPVTERSGHQLDADTRFPKVARTARRMLRHLIEAALAYHETVHVIWEPGNHDPNSSVWLMELLDAVYEGHPRVTVDTNPGKFHFYEYGRNGIMTHHGDMRLKSADLESVFAATMPEMWGRTEHRLILTGHVHHETRKDMRGCVHETVPVLIPNDAWAANAGFRGKRAMQVLILDTEHGEDERHTFNATRFIRSAT